MSARNPPRREETRDPTPHSDAEPYVRAYGYRPEHNCDGYYSMLIGQPTNGRVSSVRQAAGSGVDSGPVA